MTSTPDVVDNLSANRYEIHDGDAVAFLSYRMKGDAIEYLHSETPPALQGKGYASAIAKSALEHDKVIGRKVIATCPFVKTYIERHPDYKPLLLGS